MWWGYRKLKLQDIKSYSSLGLSVPRSKKIFNSNNKGKCEKLLNYLGSKKGEMIQRCDVMEFMGESARSVNIMIHNLKNNGHNIKIEKTKIDYFYGIFEKTENLKD